MKILFALVALVAAIQVTDAAPKALPPIEIQFEHYKKKYHKRYGCPEAENIRFHIFKDNVHEIEEHNKLFDEGKSTWKMGITQFSDMLDYENDGWLDESVPRIKIQFEEFKKNFNRKYECPEEEEIRFKVFKHNVEMIEEINKEYAEGKVTWKAGINGFSDELDFELRNHLGVIMPKHKHSV